MWLGQAMQQGKQQASKNNIRIGGRPQDFVCSKAALFNLSQRLEGRQCGPGHGSATLGPATVLPELK
jgi:hypothetical protein